jgi:hypothetical protein
MMTKPVSRNFNYWSRAGIEYQFGDPASLSQCAEGQCSCGVFSSIDFAKWNDNFAIQAPSNPGGVFWPPVLASNLNDAQGTPLQMAQGGIIDVAWQLTASHYGYIELRLCYDVDDSGTVTTACFEGEDKVIKRTEATSRNDILPLDPSHPERYYLGPSGFGWGNGSLRVSTYPSTVFGPQGVVPIKCTDQLDEGCFQKPPLWNGNVVNSDGSVTGQPRNQTGDSYEWKVQLSTEQIAKCDGNRCVLQMLYVTANSCQPPGMREYYFSQPVQDWIAKLPIDEHYKTLDNWLNTNPTFAACPPGSVEWDSPDPPRAPGGPEKFWNCADIVAVDSGPFSPAVIAGACVCFCMLLLCLWMWFHHRAGSKSASSVDLESSEDQGSGSGRVE